MPTTNPSPNMGLPIPAVGVDPGPQWAVDINSCLTLLDQHNHTPGSGVQIPTAGISVNSDFPFNDYNLTTIRSARFQAQGSPLSLPADLGCLYVSGADLYYNDTSGNQVRITQSGSVVGPTGSISGLNAPASASYVAINQTFVWQSAAATSADMDFGSATFRNITPSSNGVTVSPPASIGSNYSLTLPTLPSQTNIMTLDTSGNIVGAFYPDGSTIAVAGQVLKVPDQGITATQIANNTITASQIANNTITATQVANYTLGPTQLQTPGYNSASASLGQSVITNPNTIGISTSATIISSGTIVTKGNPLYIALINGYFNTPSPGTPASLSITITINSSPVYTAVMGTETGAYLNVPCSAVSTVAGVGAGTQTVIVYATASSAVGSPTVNGVQLCLYEFK